MVTVGGRRGAVGHHGKVVLEAGLLEFGALAGFHAGRGVQRVIDVRRKEQAEIGVQEPFALGRGGRVGGALWSACAACAVRRVWKSGSSGLGRAARGAGPAVDIDAVGLGWRRSVVWRCGSGRVEDNDVGEASGNGRDRHGALVGWKGVERHERVDKGGLEGCGPDFGIHVVDEGVSCPGQGGAAFGIAGDGDGRDSTGVAEKSETSTGHRKGDLGGFAHVDKVDGRHSKFEEGSERLLGCSWAAI